MSKIISIHQPETYPQLSFFNKILNSDLFVILDHVQYRKNYFQNRNIITTQNNNIRYLTIPVARNTTSIKNKKISDPAFLKNHYQVLKNEYKNLAYFSELDGFFENSSVSTSLRDFNMNFINWVLCNLEINTKMVFSSDYTWYSVKSDLIFEICSYFDAEIYLSGVGGKEYLNLEAFKENLISFQYNEILHKSLNNFGLNKHSSIVELIPKIGFKNISKLLRNSK